MNLDPSESEPSNPDSPNTSPTPHDHTSPLFNLFYELNELNEDSNSSGNSHFYSQTLLSYSPPRNRPPSTLDSPLNSTDLPSRTLFSHLPILNRHQSPHLSSSSSSSAFNRSLPHHIVPSTSPQLDSIPLSDINPQLIASSSLTTPLFSSQSSTAVVPLPEITHPLSATPHPLDPTNSLLHPCAIPQPLSSTLPSISTSSAPSSISLDPPTSCPLL